MNDKDKALWVRTEEGEPVKKCRDCIHCDVCELNPFLPEFSRDSVAYCGAFKNREEYVEVVHGRWDKNWSGDNIVYCNQCYMPQDMPTPYCASCGALMDLEVE